MLLMQFAEDLNLVDGFYVEVNRARGEAGRPVLEIKRLTDEEMIALFD